MNKEVVNQPTFWGRINSFVSGHTFPGVLLFVMATLALVLANSSLASTYFSWWETEITLGFGSFALTLTFIKFINDALMVIFFLMIGLEIKREFLVGELSTSKKAAFPIVAGLAGMLVPALIYLTFNFSGDGNTAGFGIPMATDIAFALGVLFLLGKRVPIALKVFLLSFAVVDDVGAIAIIAAFYTNYISWSYLLVAVGGLLILLILNRTGVRSLLPYILIGLVIWFCFLHSGIHATIAGLLIAVMIPSGIHIPVHKYTAEGRRAMDQLDQTQSVLRANRPLLSAPQQSILEGFGEKYKDVMSPLLRFYNGLHKPVYLLILPIFVLANSGISFTGEGINLLSPISLGIICGLVIGKPLGVIGLTWLVSRFGFIEKPQSVTWAQLWGIGLLGGIGFTMSMFITYLAFDNPAETVSAKLAILVGSFIAGIIGTIYLLRVTKKPELPQETELSEIVDDEALFLYEK